MLSVRKTRSVGAPQYPVSTRLRQSGCKQALRRRVLAVNCRHSLQERRDSAALRPRTLKILGFALSLGWLNLTAPPDARAADEPSEAPSASAAPSKVQSMRRVISTADAELKSKAKMLEEKRCAPNVVELFWTDYIRPLTSLRR